MNFPLMDKWIKTCVGGRVYVCVFKIKYNSATKRKKEILPFVTIWKNLEGIRLSKVSQRMTNMCAFT